MNKIGTLSALCASVFAVSALVASPGAVLAKSIGKDQVNVRSSPSLNAEIVFTAPLGYPIEIKKVDDNWAFFHDWQNNSGWVYKPLVSDIDTAVILPDKVNVRSQATTRSRVVTTATSGEIYEILDKKDNWVRIGYYHGGSPVGWVRSDLVFGD